MLGSEIRLISTSSQLTSDALTYEVDCYPYAMRGLLFGMLLSIGLWGSVISVVILF